MIVTGPLPAAAPSLGVTAVSVGAGGTTDPHMMLGMTETANRHLLIAGTGRAGSSFLVKWLGEVGLSTGFESTGWFEDARAGFERRLSGDPDTPYVVKDPLMHEYLDEILQTEQMVIDALVIPVRNLHDAAASRVLQERTAAAKRGDQYPAVHAVATGTPGGVVYSLSVHDQESVLARGLARLIEIAAKHRLPTIFLHFPSFVADFDSLWIPFEPFLHDRVTESVARHAFLELADPGAVRVCTNSETYGTAPVDGAYFGETIEPKGDLLLRSGNVPTSKTSDP